MAYFDPSIETSIHRRFLPHWDQQNVWCFVTWRLGDSLPSGRLLELTQEKEAWLKFHPPPWDHSTEAEFHERFSDRLDEWLDAGIGCCALRDSQNAEIVSNAIEHFEGERLVLAAYVVMPTMCMCSFSLLRRTPWRNWFKYGKALPPVKSMSVAG